MNDASTLFQPLPKGPISEIIVQRITDALINGELRPGDKIPTEQELSERLGVGRNAVREAIKVLVAFGVLEIRRSEGTFVVERYHQNVINSLLYGLPLTEKSTEDILAFKIGVYQTLLYLAVLNATDEEIATLRAYCDAFYSAAVRSPIDTKELFRASEYYNRHLAAMTHNPMVVQLNDITMRFASYTRVKALEVSLERGQPTLLPEAYYKDLPVLEKRDKESILPVIEERLRLWRELLL